MGKLVSLAVIFFLSLNIFSQSITTTHIYKKVDTIELKFKYISHIPLIPIKNIARLSFFMAVGSIIDLKTNLKNMQNILTLEVILLLHQYTELKICTIPHLENRMMTQKTFSIILF